jgi:hypothetical protein
MMLRVLSGLTKLAISIPLPHGGKPHQAVCHTERPPAGRAGSPDVLGDPPTGGESKDKSGRSPRLTDGQGSADSHVESPSTSLTDCVRCAQADGEAVQRNSADQQSIVWLGVLLCVVLLFFSACASTKQYPPGSLTIDGVMHHSNVEGGCWVFRAADGQSYELIGDAAKELLREGLRAEIVVRARRDVMSICMVGRIVEVLEVKEIDSDSSPP